VVQVVWPRPGRLPLAAVDRAAFAAVL